MILLPIKVTILLSKSISEISTSLDGGYDVQGVHLSRLDFAYMLFKFIGLINP